MQYIWTNAGKMIKSFWRIALSTFCRSTRRFVFKSMLKNTTSKVPEIPSLGWVSTSSGNPLHSWLGVWGGVKATLNSNSIWCFTQCFRVVRWQNLGIFILYLQLSHTWVIRTEWCFSTLSDSGSKCAVGVFNVPLLKTRVFWPDWGNWLPNNTSTIQKYEEGYTYSFVRFLEV